MSGAAGQNGLRDLEARIKSLPDQERLKRLCDLFRNTQTLTLERRDGVRTALDRVNALRAIEVDTHLLEAEEKVCVSSAQAKAGELFGLITITSPDSSKIGARFDAIKRATTSVNNAVSTTWNGICRQYEDRAKALRPLAEKLSPHVLVPIDALVRLLTSLGGSPPTSAVEVRSLLDAIDAFNTAIKSMKTDGRDRPVSSGREYWWRRSEGSV